MGRQALTAALAVAVGYTLASQQRREREEAIAQRRNRQINGRWRFLSESDWIASQQRGHPYEGSSTAELEILQDPKYVPKGSRVLKAERDRLSIDGGYNLLYTILRADLGDKQRRAYGRLQAAWAVSTKRSTPDLFVKVFNDLSTVLFGGVLFRQVYLAWEDLSAQSVSGKCRSASKRPNGIPRVTILLDRTMIGSRHKSYIWGTLIHEMLHAYLNIVAKRHRGYTTDHGPVFDDAAARLVAKLRFDGLEARHVT